MSTVGGYHDVCGGYHEYRGGIHDVCGGYHEYRGGCSILWGELKKISIFEGFDSQKYRCSFLSIIFFPCA